MMIYDDYKDCNSSSVCVWYTSSSLAKRQDAVSRSAAILKLIHRNSDMLPVNFVPGAAGSCPFAYSQSWKACKAFLSAKDRICRKHFWGVAHDWRRFPQFTAVHESTPATSVLRQVKRNLQRMTLVLEWKNFKATRNEKNPALLFMKYWLFNSHPYVMVYEIYPI